MRFRVYDFGPNVIDRYTVVFAGTGEYLGMSADPFWPQGFGQHGWHEHDVDAVATSKEHDGRYELGWGGWWVPRIGSGCHLGARIRFRSLPKNARRAAAIDYRAYHFPSLTPNDED